MLLLRGLGRNAEKWRGRGRSLRLNAHDFLDDGPNHNGREDVDERKSALGHVGAGDTAMRQSRDEPDGFERYLCNCAAVESVSISDWIVIEPFPIYAWYLVVVAYVELKNWKKAIIVTPTTSTDFIFERDMLRFAMVKSSSNLWWVGGGEFDSKEKKIMIDFHDFFFFPLLFFAFSKKILLAFQFSLWFWLHFLFQLPWPLLRHLLFELIGERIKSKNRIKKSLRGWNYYLWLTSFCQRVNLLFKLLVLLCPVNQKPFYQRSHSGTQ